jgi:choline kinase/phosphatidylglycerophosphate synthase
MKALILAAGVGKRLSPYTDYSPKCLIDIGGTTLMERMLQCLNAVGVREVSIVIGHLKEKIKEKLGTSFNGISVSYIENNRYQEGSILSLWYARDMMQGGDLIIMDADVLFPVQALERLVNSKHRNCFLMDESFKDSLEEMKLGVRSDRVIAISRKLSNGYDKIGEGVGFLKVSKESLPLLKEKLDEFYQSNRTSVEYEDLLDEWLKIEAVGFEPVQDLPWTEVDFFDDLRKAWTRILPKVEALEKSKSIHPLNRRLSKYFTRYWLKTSWTPNQITALSLMTGLIGLLFFSRGSYIACLAGALFFQLCYILDNCDGEVARAKGISTRWGGWFDVGCDAVIHLFLFPAIAWGLYRGGMGNEALLLGELAMYGILITFSIFMIKRFLNKRNEQFLYLSPKKRKEIKILEYLKAGDFSLFVLVFALFDLMGVFLWVSAVALQLFWISALLFRLEETSVG